MHRNIAQFRMIHFFGPDGAGKTTQVAELIALLESQGLRTRRAWVRSPHTLAFLMMNLLYALGQGERLHNPSGREFLRPRVDRNKITRFLWTMLEVVSVLPLVLREAVIPIRLGRIVVAERYVLDTVTTIGYFLHDERFIDSWAARFLYRFIPKDTLVVYLDADYPTILRRRGEIAEPEEFIEFQRRVYRTLANRLGTLVIYTPDHTIEETHAIICSALANANRVGVAQVGRMDLTAQRSPDPGREERT